MDDLEEIEDEGKEEEEEELLSLSLSLVSHSQVDGDRNTRRKKNKNHDDLSTSQGSSDGGDQYGHHLCHQVEILGLLQQREQMLRRINTQEDSKRDKDLHMVHQLQKITTSIDEHNFSSAVAGLTKMYQSASLTGHSVQRAAAYFADGLAAKLLKEKPSFYDMIMKEPTPAQEFLAFTHLYKLSPCYQFSHFTANQAILEAFEKDQGRNNSETLHVLDFDLAYGFQWPSLIQSLSEKANTTNTIISLRIAGFARSLEELVETEARLVSFSKGFDNLVFEFQGLLRASTQIHNTVKRRENETLAVNLVSCLHSTSNHTFLNTLYSIRCLHPSIVVLVQQGGPGPTNVMDSLHFYAAMFDSLDDCLPRDNLERLSIEKNHLGKEIKNALANYCFTEEMGVSDHVKRERLSGWQRMMEEDYGLGGIKLSARTVMQAKLLLRMRNPSNPDSVEADFNAGLRVSDSEDGKAISLVCQDRELVTASAWRSLV